jgi:V8-like Glu-specific endopeptidase
VTVCGFGANNIKCEHSNILEYNQFGGGEYDIDTLPGQSGAPVFFTGQDTVWVVGIHKAYGGSQHNKNICTLLTAPVVFELATWAQ